ncbi:hypothetical protein [Streptomyces pluripotens]|uniref:hypothetical protein n=1 Tax=Streptomyces pluripotens TaxID=1355015 RepID=UPI00131B31A0|nr:hypothetical protein [Streptomyces pluripotens]
MNQEERQPIKASLENVLRDLPKGRGIRRPLRKAFEEKPDYYSLRSYWDIGVDDTPDVVCAKMAIQLERLVSRLADPKAQIVARVSFNLVGPGLESLGLAGLDLKERHEATRNYKPLHGSYEANRKKFSIDIVPDLVSFGLSKPAPILKEELDIFLARYTDIVAPVDVLQEIPPSPTPEPAPKPQKRKIRPLVLSAITLVVVASAVGIATLTTSFGQRTGNKAQSTSEPRPAPSSSPPVQIESVSPLANNEPGDMSFVLPDKLSLTSTGLVNFNKNVYSNSTAFRSWYTGRQSAQVGFAFTTVTLRGNESAEVTVQGMSVNSTCRAPLRGTIFSSPSQGEGDNIGMAFNLDVPDPIPQKVAFSPESGAGTPYKSNYFVGRHITLARGESVTLSIGAFTKLHDCSFRFEMLVATTSGAFTETIDDHGKPFELTALAKPRIEGAPFSGYQATYINGPYYGLSEWQKVDPATYKHK